MKTLKTLLLEKLTKNIKEGDTILNTSNGRVDGYNYKNLKFLDVNSIERDYKLIDKDCNFLTFTTISNGTPNPEFDEINKKLVCIIMNEVKYYKDFKKMEQEVLTVVQKYSNNIFKIEIGESTNRWNNMKGNVHFSIKFNRIAELSFTFYPDGYEETPYKTTSTSGGYIIHYDED
jgi:hypothetical protein